MVIRAQLSQSLPELQYVLPCRRAGKSIAVWTSMWSMTHSLQLSVSLVSITRTYITFKEASDYVQLNR